MFVGRVTAVLPPEHDADFRMPLQAVTFAVSRRIKGVDGALIRIETPVHDASCGIHFDVGRDYLVYAHGTPARLFATLCSRTREAAGAEDEIEALGGGI